MKIHDGRVKRRGGPERRWYQKYSVTPWSSRSTKNDSNTDNIRVSIKLGSRKVGGEVHQANTFCVIQRENVQQLIKPKTFGGGDQTQTGSH